MFKLTLILALWAILSHSPVSIEAHRSLLHWKRDLEHRLNSYAQLNGALIGILDSSIYQPGLPEAITSAGNVRFSDLIVPHGSLVLESHIAQPTVRIMMNKTESYVRSKSNELYQIRSQLETIERQVNDPSQRFIYKGLRGSMVPQVNFSRIEGTRVFKQFMYGHVLESRDVQLQHINSTPVDQVIRATYMDNPALGLFDSQSRLFFEGRKTFWHTVFTRQLKSGCCDRLRPLHTSRMMTRSTNQTIMAPILITTNDPYNHERVVIRQLRTNQLLNRALFLSLPHNVTGRVELLPSPPSNQVQLHNLINIRQPDQPEYLKTVVFKQPLMVDDAQLSSSYGDNRLLIGFAAPPELAFDLSHENYLLRYLNFRNNRTNWTQRVAGPLVFNCETHFSNFVNAISVNRIPNFRQFVVENIVRIDKPAVITGSVQFNALPSVLNARIGGSSRSAQNEPIMYVARDLHVQLINGMRIPQDLILLDKLQPNNLIRISRPVEFVNSAEFVDFLQVHRLVNGMQMPAGVIPIHLNDFMGSVGQTNLWFLDGINVGHITAQDGQFDDIILREAYGDAQSIIMRSVFVPQPDGSHLIRAPLRVINLRLHGADPNQGLLNGFRPQGIIELSRQPLETIYGKKTFLAPVEAIDCVFGEINRLANWTNHLIRIDRPGTVQTVHTKLAFQNQPIYSNATGGSQGIYPAGSLLVDRLHVEFLPNKSPAYYLNNLNFSPEFYILHQTLTKTVTNHTGARYRVLGHVRIINPRGPSLVNRVDLNDVVTLDAPFNFADRFVMVGKVDVAGSLSASRITSNYPIDVMDLVQFDKYRIPIVGSRAPIRLNNLVLSTDNRASFLHCHLLNGIPFNEFVSTIMSLTKPQAIDTSLVFTAPVNLEGPVRTDSSLNGIKDFRRFAHNLKSASYSFEDGLQCNSIMLRV